MGFFAENAIENNAHRLLLLSRSCRLRENRRFWAGGSDLLDGREQPIAAAAADEGPHLLGLDRAARIAADQPVGVRGRTPEADEIVDRAPSEIGGGVVQIA